MAENGLPEGLGPEAMPGASRTEGLNSCKVMDGSKTPNGWSRNSGVVLRRPEGQ